MKVAIPSYKRAGLLREMTLAYLDRSGVDPRDVLILVATPYELASYRHELPVRWWPCLRVTAPGLCESKNTAIERYLEDGDEVFWLDDDVQTIQRWDGEEIGLLTLCSIGFAYARVADVYLWGVQTAPERTRATEPTVGLHHIVGCAYGQRIRRKPELQLVYGDALEDHERTLRHWQQDGRVLRLERYAPVTSYYRPDEGGIQGRSYGSVLENLGRLQDHWGGLVHHAGYRDGWPVVELAGDAA